MNTNKTRSYIFVIISMIFWSFSFVWFKIANVIYDPITIIFLRLIISSTLLFSILILSKRFQKIKTKDLKFFVSLSFFQPFLYFIGESFGLQLISSTIVAVILSTIPIFTSIVAYFTYNEKPRLTTLLGMVISIFGICVMILDGNMNLKISPWGILLLLLAITAAIGYSFTLKNLVTKYSATNIVFYQNSIGIIYFIPVLLIFNYNKITNFEFNTDALLAILQLAVFASTLAFILFSNGLKQLGPVTSNIFVNIIPVFTALFSFLMGMEDIGFKQIISIIIVISGLFISQTNQKTNT